MKLKDFTFIENKVNPLMCHKYILKENGLRFEIFTLNYGKTYLATIDEHCPLPRLPHNHVNVFKCEVDFIQGPKYAIKKFKEFLKNNTLCK